MPGTVGIYTLGCKVNQYESEAIGEALTARGFSLTDPDGACDLYIINTCTVTAESDRKARQFIRRARGHNPAAFILVTGCFSQVSPRQVCAIEGVDYVCGTANKLSLVAEAVRLTSGKAKETTPRLSLCDPAAAPFEPMCIRRFDRTRAYVKIEDGCENHCAYCIIPAARGHVRSKPLADVLAEAEALTRGGCREVVLTGIETGSWGKEWGDANLADLLEAVDKIPGIGRVRLGSLDPSLMRPAFVERIARLSSLAPHFHLSMQSGSSAVLARMKRKYNAPQALNALARIREAIPGVQFTTDMIAGFPGESETEFAETLAFLREANFLAVHAFPYSRRAGTPADKMPNQVPEQTRRERVRQMSAVAAETRRSILQTALRAGKPVHVLFETVGKDGVTYTGHTPDFMEVSVRSDLPLRGEIGCVTLTDTAPDGMGLVGTLRPAGEI